MWLCGLSLAKARSPATPIVAAYFKHSDTLEGPINSQLLAKLLALLQETRYQFLLVVDWNTPPSSFEETILEPKFNWQIIAPPQHFFQARCLTTPWYAANLLDACRFKLNGLRLGDSMHW